MARSDNELTCWQAVAFLNFQNEPACISHGNFAWNDVALLASDASRAKSGPRLLWLAWHVATPWASQTVLVEAKRITTATGDGTNAVSNQNVTTDNFSCQKWSIGHAMLSCKEWSIGHAILQAQMSTSMPDCGCKRRTLRAAQCTSEAISCHQTCAETW